MINPNNNNNFRIKNFKLVFVYTIYFQSNHFGDVVKLIKKGLKMKTNSENLLIANFKPNNNVVLQST